MTVWGDDKYARPFGVILDIEPGRRLTGQIRLKRAGLLDSNVVSVADTSFLHIRNGGSVYGVSPEGKVSLLECVDGALTTTSWDDVSIRHGDLSFRYAVFGTEYLRPDEKCIKSIQFVLEGLKTSAFRDDEWGRFGYLLDPHPEILDAIERRRPDYLPGDFVKGATVSYFTGKREYAPRFETALGSIHVGRSTEHDSYGRSVTDTPHVAVEFDDAPTTLGHAWEKMRDIRHFFAWLMGYPPRWRDVVVCTSDSGADHPCMFDVFAPDEWSDVSRADANTTLIHGSTHPDHLASVMQAWLERNRNAQRRQANFSFFGNLRGKRTIETGIVTAANAFDLMPDEDKPVVPPLPAEVSNVLKAAAEHVKGLMPSGVQREDVLSALGRIRSNRRLRNIVEHRASNVVARFGQHRLPRLLDLIRQAIECRNHYTHGGDRGASTAPFSIESVAFLIDTLTFIYTAAELLDCGWEPGKVEGLDQQLHPLMAYVRNYEQRLARMRQAL